MDSIAQNKRYLPHEISTKMYAVKLYRETKDISFVCRRYHISKASLMRWNKQYDGTRESLTPKSHRPLTPHPNAHTEEELKWIRDYHRRNPNISICELYGKLREDKAYSRHPGSLYRVFVRLGYRKKVESDEKWELLLKKSGNSNEYDYEDETAVPGCYYEYKVESIGHCSKEVNGSISDIGYPSPTGTISGSVTYGTMGMGVPNVKVCASQSFGGKSDSRYYSRRLGDVFYIQYNDDLEDFFYSKSFSLQMWARVDSLQTLSSPYIVDKMGDFSLYLERESSSDLNFQCVLTSQASYFLMPENPLMNVHLQCKDL